jgi:hypothetical protein
VLLPDKNVRERLLHSSASLFRGWRRRPGCHNSAGRSDPREGPFARAGSGPSNLRPRRVPGRVVSGMGRHEPAKFETGGARFVRFSTWCGRSQRSSGRTAYMPANWVTVPSPCQ